MDETTEIIVGWAVMIGVVVLAVWAARRQMKRPNYYTLNPFDPADTKKGEPLFASGAREWFWYFAGFAVTATVIHFAVVRY